ncbi:MAG: PD-(D/E)XK nuclease family protein [Dysgonamonadaceae bacterium]|jgi:hypothetical protein|nr:PD-(D/E)XK nuclease family protein [Dysgonamonadaceae bacterium]
MDKLIEKLKTIETADLKKPFLLLEMLYQKVKAKELSQSKMLAGLLSPDENHGHGINFAESFLKEIGVDAKLNKDGNLKVGTERKVVDGRIDILISWFDGNKNHAVIIENKLNNAANQPNQPNKYYKSLCNEDKKYEVDKIVYMPVSKEYQRFEDTEDANDEVRKIVINFDAKDIVEWIEKKVKPEKGGAIDQYKEFLKCLILNKYVMQKSLEIQQKLSSLEEINKFEELAKIVATPEWGEARVKSITDKLKQLPIEVRGKSKLTDECECNNYVQLFFREDDRIWIELWLYKTHIRMYLVSYDEKQPEPEIAGIKFVQANGYIGRYYYHSDNLKFDYSNESSLIETLKLILQELKI